MNKIVTICFLSCFLCLLSACSVREGEKIEDCAKKPELWQVPQTTDSNNYDEEIRQMQSQKA
ncbi:MAG TPA: hypothetical protein VI959_03750 [Alphaproteobacteria bacterium]|nr:hypothetical protein [Alphaproteobacteria bacterium]